MLQNEAVVGGFVGSAPRLLAECLDLATALGIDPDTDPQTDEFLKVVERGVDAPRGWQLYGVETFTCLQLIRASRVAVASGAAVVFC